MIETVIDARKRSLGGFDVGRVLPSPARHMVGPFIFLDHMGPVTFEKGVSRDIDVRPHPHIGLATVTYLLSGEIVHRDSVGSEQTILPGEVNWMTAGSGITHSERFEKARAQGDLVHGLQSWVALPDGEEEIAPSFSHHGADDLPQSAEKGARLRVIAGKAFGLEARVKTHSPMFYVHAELEENGRLSLPDTYPERAAFIVSGRIEAEGERYGQDKMLVFEAREPAVIKALSPSTVMLLGGDPVGPRFIEWNFVSSSRQRIEDAKSDWKAGRMKLPDLDNKEFTPLPGG